MKYILPISAILLALVLVLLSNMVFNFKGELKDTQKKLDELQQGLVANVQNTQTIVNFINQQIEAQNGK